MFEKDGRIYTSEEEYLQEQQYFRAHPKEKPSEPRRKTPLLLGCVLVFVGSMSALTIALLFYFFYSLAGMSDTIL